MEEKEVRTLNMPFQIDMATNVLTERKVFLCGSSNLERVICANKSKAVGRAFFDLLHYL